MSNDLITARQLSIKYKMDKDKVKLILKGIDPEGRQGGYDAWSQETFLEARGTYYKTSGKDSSEGILDDTEDISDEIKSAKLRIALAQAEEKELNNLERKNILVLRVKVENLIRYQCNLIASKLRELTAGPGGDDRYNQEIEEMSKSMQHYLIEEDIENIIPMEVIEDIEEDMLCLEKEDYEI